MFKPLQEQSIPQAEEAVLKLWQERQIFAQSVSQRAGKTPFVFYEGPPTANGRPGIHHVLARTFKDTICRFQTLKGKYVLRRAGWDTHGLPVELQVEKALGLKNKQDIEHYGVAAFNEQCRQSVWQYKDEWEKLTLRMGYWVDMEHPYSTLDPEYIQSVWWGLKQIWDKGLIYQDYKVVPYCTRCGTSLSLAEVAQGYKDVTDTSVYVKFKLLDEENAYLLAWTTTPWTLPGNVALAVGKNILYSKVKVGEEIYYLVTDRLRVLDQEYTKIVELAGSELAGRPYQPLFGWLDLGKVSGRQSYRVVAADFITTDDGTGIVHTAVMYGEEDFELGKSESLPAVHTVDEQGLFNELVPPWQGQYVKKAEPAIIEYLKEQQLLYRSEPVTHSYPFCWRCGTALLYYARSAWFIKITDQTRQRLVELNDDITWVPEHVKQGRFGKWLAGLRDWSISRERYWGTPLPIWICQSDQSHRLLCADLEEVKQHATASSLSALQDPSFDPHKPTIDSVELQCPECPGTMKRVPEVLDVWFDSGAMPFAQWGYPRQNAEQFKQQFPADFIAEGIDQTRGWFNSLLILSTLIFDRAAYRSVITPNLVLDEKGHKMSKSKGNVVDPWTVIGETGIDALRLYFLSVNQPSETKNFALPAVREVYRKTLMLWWNVANFFLLYAELDQWQTEQKGEQTVLDRWLVARVDHATTVIDQCLTELDSFTAAREFRSLVDDLSTWYLRRSRKRRDPAFYATLHQALVQISIIASPLTPFMAEAIYQSLRTEAMPESVHLADYPVVSSVDQPLLSAMAELRQLVTLGHAARATASLKTRQPLAEARLAGLVEPLSPDLQAILASELNVKRVSQNSDRPSDWLATEQGSYAISLDPHLTPELKEEGLLRELVRELQALRKRLGCQPGQLVTFYYETNDELLQKLLVEQVETVKAEVAAEAIEPQKQGEKATELQSLELNGHRLAVGLTHG